ncbi:GreA/GreB family elongation factor [Desulfuromonas soudanensis]|uniref:GreA/GreB family elongation factor n=1 Tax=Desulfuromonas soudanensis TaxID=1603606 RepID=A0A0M4DEL8_9BACT|nr:GreA/GreB family elongation factor [Desulfuromonas soudanensis]ALC15025.1 GreA/GreB family elongation factor [Desulfuromonas soudanensis]
MDKEPLRQRIIEQLAADLELFLQAARAAHEAATNAENLPDNEYETLALEASYVAQGQANRAQEIRMALESYKALELRPFGDGEPIRLGALVTLEGEDGRFRTVLIGPEAGGLKVFDGNREIIVITPSSPLGQELLGRIEGDQVTTGVGDTMRDYEIIAVG